MWSAPSPVRPAVPASYSPFGHSAWDPYLSISRPFVTLRVGVIPHRGYVLTLTDSKARTISTPTVPVEEIYRAFKGEHVEVRSGGFAVEITPVDGALHIIGGPLAGLRLEGVFAPEVLRAAINGAGPA